MSRLNPLSPETATGKTKELFDAVQAKLGRVPNIMRGFANSPAVLEGYLGWSGALQRGALSDKLREQIALTVAEINSCDYCLAAHSAIGKMTGLSEKAIRGARHITASESREEAALQFARILVEKRGFTDDAEIEKVRAAGFNDGEIAEIVANVALSIFTNYFNHVAETEIDFPPAPPLSPNP